VNLQQSININSREGREGEEMKRAKLIKREEIIERQHAASSADPDASAPATETPPPSMVKMTFDAVRKWANEPRTNE
jgi:hypothetical protein